jgi:hypothetical protein
MVATPRTATKLYYANTFGLAIGLYRVPNITSSDTADVGSTGTNDFTKVFLALQVPLASAAYAATTLTPATNLVLSAAAQTGEDSLLVVVGAGT